MSILSKNPDIPIDPMDYIRSCYRMDGLWSRYFYNQMTGQLIGTFVVEVKYMSDLGFVGAVKTYIHQTNEHTSFEIFTTTAQLREYEDRMVHYFSLDRAVLL